MLILSNEQDILRKRSRKVEKVDFSFLEELNLEKVLNHGLGISAPQVGKLERIIIAENYEMINPVILDQSLDYTYDFEGCLSFPNEFYKISRPREIKVFYQDRYMNPKEFTAGGMLSRIIQHEIDHLNGILFIDRCKK